MYPLRYVFLAVGVAAVFGAAVAGHLRATSERDSQKAKTTLLLTIILALLSAAGFLLFHFSLKDTAVQTDDAPVIADSAPQPAETDAPAVESQPSETQSAETAVPESSASEFALDGLASFPVTSENLHDGVWDSVITNTENGQNRSPQLAWDPVPGAECYAVYMVDTTVENWLHWKSGGITETSLPEGWAPADEYIGPYPPGGTHTYDIYVFALKKPLEQLKGAFNSSNPVFLQKTLPSLDIADDDESGNVLACGRISGTYTKGGGESTPSAD